MNDVNIVLDRAYEELLLLGIPQIISSQTRLFGDNKEELHALYTDLNNNYPELLERFNKILNGVYEQIESIDKSNMLPNNFLDLLLNLKKSEFSYVDKILEVTQYETRVNQLFDGISSQFYAGGEMSADEIKIIQSRLSLAFNDSKLAEEVIARGLTTSPSVSYSSFCNAVTIFIKNQLAQSIGDDNLSIIISPSEVLNDVGMANCNGGQAANLLVIREQLIRNFYNSGNPELIEIIFHELRHAQQRKMIQENNNFFNDYQIDMIREFLNAKYVKDYYKENYDRIFYEQDARFFAVEEYRLFLERHGYKLSPEAEKRYFEYTSQYHPSNFDRRRMMGQTETTIRNIFDETISMHPEELENYPKLKFLYKAKDGIVVSKTTEELQSDFQTLITNPNLSDEEKKRLHFSYSNFIDKIIADLKGSSEQLSHSSNETNPYIEYRQQLVQAYLEDKDSDTILYSQFSVKEGDNPQCEHILSKVEKENRIKLCSKTFEYTDEFKSQMLEPSAIDFAKCSPINSSEVVLQPHDQSACLNVCGENNNVLIINGITPTMANTISSSIQQVNPTLYQQQFQNQILMNQQFGPQLTLTQNVNNGFIDVLVLFLMITSVCGLGILIAMIVI